MVVPRLVRATEAVVTRGGAGAAAAGVPPRTAMAATAPAVPAAASAAGHASRPGPRGRVSRPGPVVVHPGREQVPAGGVGRSELR